MLPLPQALNQSNEVDADASNQPGIYCSWRETLCSDPLTVTTFRAILLLTKSSSTSKTPSSRSTFRKCGIDSKISNTSADFFDWYNVFLSTSGALVTSATHATNAVGGLGACTPLCRPVNHTGRQWGAYPDG